MKASGAVLTQQHWNVGSLNAVLTQQHWKFVGAKSNGGVFIGVVRAKSRVGCFESVRRSVDTATLEFWIAKHSVDTATLAFLSA